MGTGPGNPYFEIGQCKEGTGSCAGLRHLQLSWAGAWTGGRSGACTGFEGREGIDLHLLLFISYLCFNKARKGLSKSFPGQREEGKVS